MAKYRRQAGINVEANIHSYNEQLPLEYVDRFTTKQGVPNTWGEAVEFRINKQNSGFRNNNPNGSWEMQNLKLGDVSMFEVKDFYPEFEYPYGYLKLKSLNLIDFDFWYFIPNDQLAKRIMGLKTRYPNRQLVPFARRDDNDDIACFEIGKGEIVQIIHDFSSQGFEQRKEYESIWLWAKDAFEELIASE